MIRVGGNSYNNGIRFTADKYNINFVYKKNFTQIFLQKNKNKTFKFFERIPFIRCFALLLKTNKFLFLLLLSTTIYSLTFTPYSVESTNISPSYSTFDIVFMHIIAIATMFMLLMICIKIIINSKVTAQYHGAEHKVIFTNYEEKELTLENCRKSPRVNDNCGTMLVTLLIFVQALLTEIVNFFDFHVLANILFLISFSIAYELFHLNRNTPGIRWLFKIGYWLQEKLFTREPTDFQLTQAIEAFKLLEKAEKGQIPEDELQQLLKNNKKANFTDKFF